MSAKLFCLMVAALHISGSLSAETTNAAGFRYYLQNAFQTQFETWLKNNNESDPTPLQPIDQILGEYVSTSLFNIRYYLKSEQMVGLVTNKKELFPDQITVDLIQFYLSVAVNTTGEIVFQGDYTTSGSGSMFNGRPLAGHGVWNMTVTGMQQVLGLYFDIGSDGFVSLKNSRPYLTVTLDVDEEKTYFEGLWDNRDDGFAPEIRKQMTNELVKRYSKWEDETHPSGNLLLNFLKEAVAKSSLHDILGTSEPATTVTPTTTPTTQEDDTTPSPTLPSDVETTKADGSTESPQGSSGSRADAFVISIVFFVVAALVNTYRS